MSSTERDYFSAGALVGSVVGILTFMILSTLFGHSPGFVRAEAVKTGHAEYYLDENHQRQWRWKEIKNEVHKKD